MKPIPIIELAVLEEICNVLAHTSEGLTNTEINRCLRDCNIEDSNVGVNKRTRLFDALASRQNQDGSSNHVLAFIMRAMDPVRYFDKESVFQNRRVKLNRVLAMQGLELREDGKLMRRDRAATITEAQQRADNFRASLEQRGVHPDVLKSCRQELLERNYFHAVLEAAKSVADKIREKSGLTTDGAILAQDAFSHGKKPFPRLALNGLRNESEKSEHTGLMNLMIGFFGTFRNPTAHALRIHWEMTEQDALDMMTLASLLHRRLDESVETGITE